MPTPTNANATNNYTYNGVQTQDTNQFDVRIDQNLRSSDNLFIHYDYDKSNFVVPGAIPSPKSTTIPIGPYLSTSANGGTSEPLFNQGATLGYTRVLGGSMVSESHLALVRWHAQITPLGIGYNTASALGMPGINFNTQSGGMPAFTISGLTEIGDNTTYPEDSAQTTIQGDSALTWVKDLTHLSSAWWRFVITSMPSQASMTVAHSISMENSPASSTARARRPRWPTLPWAPWTPEAALTWMELRDCAPGNCRLMCRTTGASANASQ